MQLALRLCTSKFVLAGKNKYNTLMDFSDSHLFNNPRLKSKTEEV